MVRGVRAFAWACASAAILLAGLWALVFGTAALGPAGDAAGRDAVQRAALTALCGTLAREALLPQAALALAAWLALARLRPRADASWGALAASLFACALLAFAPVGAFTFQAWSPRGAGDVVATAALLSGAVALGLWLGRRLVPGLGPGCFEAAP
jgi:hypothetical protein